MAGGRNLCGRESSNGISREKRLNELLRFVFRFFLAGEKLLLPLRLISRAEREIHSPVGTFLDDMRRKTSTDVDRLNKLRKCARGKRAFQLTSEAIYDSQNVG